MKKILGVFVIVMLLLAGCGNKVRVSKDALEYVGRNYNDVKQEFETMGFKNVEVKEIIDLTSKSALKDNQVGAVKIDGVMNFVKKDQFSKNTEVVIEYHTIPKLKIPFSPEELKDIEFSDLEKVFKDAKFENVKVGELYDLDPDLNQEGSKIVIRVNGGSSWVKDSLIPYDSEIDIEKHYTYEKYEIDIYVDFIGNLVFNKYDVDLLWGKENKLNMKHGKDGNVKVRDKKGTYTLKFQKSGDTSVYGSVTIDLSENKEASYQIYCYEDSVKVTENYVRAAAKENETKVPMSSSEYESKNYKNVVDSLKNAGFSNIQTSVVYDIYFGITEVESVASVSINGKDKFSKGDIFPKEALIIVTYHMNEEDDPVKIAAKQEEERRQEEERIRKEEEQKKAEEAAAKEAALREKLERNAPKEMAKRAVIVAMTNGQATDVFKKDGNTYDEKKFHKYSDLGDFFLYVKKEGNWTAQSEYTWKVDGMVLAIFSSNARIKVDCYVAKSDDSYKLMQVKKVMAAEEDIDSDDPSKINVETMDASKKDSYPYLIVASKLIEEDRDMNEQDEIITAREEHIEWALNQFSLWDGSHKKSVELIKESLYDPTSFKYIDKNVMELTDDKSLKTVNDTLESIGSPYKVSKGDLLIFTDYSANNLSDKRVTATACTVSIKKEDVVILLSLTMD